MSKVNCSVIGCSDITNKINKWKKETCTKHNLEAEGNCKKKGDYLECKPPFHLHNFPGPIKCKQLREAWIKAVKWEPFDKKGSWQPDASDRICSIHFVNVLATDGNLRPILFLGYESKEKKWWRTLFGKPLEKKWGKGDITPVTSTSQEEEVPLQANFIDENLDVNLEKLH